MAKEETLEIRLIDLPREGEFRVVQMILDGELVMLCGHNYHSEILENFLRQIGIQPIKKTIKGLLEEKEIPELSGNRYSVMGMGMAKISNNTKQFQLPYGESADYKIGTDYIFRKQLEQQFKDWKIGTI